MSSYSTKPMKMLLYHLAMAVSLGLNTIPQSQKAGGDLGSLVRLEVIAKHPGMKEENPNYVKIRRQIEIDQLGVEPAPEKLEDTKNEPESKDFMHELLSGEETFLDRIRARIVRNKERIVQSYR
ncbi:uncharacterized protein VICG_00749 [Vittaforma corneae ATCC 50505]|uniref:Uncharacterized protein n=1 Tax=Vittaforma corneae (strain ATCC 50505) TaxID=993615 RepID=L2GMJ9_VITCO|nr:uncharacterized protein VICG_00749 [Vittaforma corneae ATCC 50505]ELA42108.1 hypothetical protein VICG_00749 [Vittaforma corneae ATCC 50505]